MLKWLNNKKKDNKGFSLVELIIVVAIMAILVGLLAPQYIKYVEKSRKSADATNLDQMVNALQVYAADADSNLPAAAYTITITGGTDGASSVKAYKTGTTTEDSDATTAAETAIEKTAPNFKKTKLKSNKWGDSKEDVEITATVTIDEEGGTTITYTPDKLNDFINATKKSE